MQIFNFDADTPDPTKALLAFQWSMAAARRLGLTRRTEHVLAEQLIKGEAKIVFYSSGGGGVSSLILDDNALTWEDEFETIKFVYERRALRLRERRAAAKAITDLAKFFAPPAIAMETRQGEDVQQASSRSDDSAAIAQTIAQPLVNGD